MIVLVDYHKGNIRSVERGLASCGAAVVVSDDPTVLAQASAIVLPGVGAFTDAMDSLDELGLTEVLKQRIDASVPFLGICLGQHLLFEGGMEHAGSSPRAGLGIMEGVVELLPKTDSEGMAYKIPHVGWNSVEFPAAQTPSPLFAGIPEGEHFYFTHSYVVPDGPYTIATTKHSVTFPSAVQRESVYGVQFHPEKSSRAGAELLANFVKLAS